MHAYAQTNIQTNTDTSINTYIPTRDLAHSSAPLAENTRDRVSARLPSSGPGGVASGPPFRAVRSSRLGGKCCGGLGGCCGA